MNTLNTIENRITSEAATVRFRIQNRTEAELERRLPLNCRVLPRMWQLSLFAAGDAYGRALFTPLRRSRRFHYLRLMAAIVMVMIVLPAWRFFLNRFKCQAMARALHTPP